MPAPEYRFEVAFSFAGPHRDKVRAIAEIVSAAIDPDLKDRSQGRVFFDEWFEHRLNGDNADVILQGVYHEQSRMVVMDVSEDYSDRAWCQAEAAAIRSLRMSIDTARDETARLRLAYIRFDDGKVPGVLRNVIDWDGQKKSASQLADLICKRLREIPTSPSPRPPVSPSPPLLPPPILFFHSATNDDRYSRRERELAWLDECAKDSRIRIATVTGQGGLGKTSLVGHWIEKQHGWRHRAFRGVFFYSFYSNRDPDNFFAAFLKFVCQVENIVALPKDRPLHHLAAAACRRWSYLIVLDGLEVLQHGEDDPAHYGWINDGELTEFVARVGAQGDSLLVLTSRFPFPKITNEHPHHARAKELPLLDAAEGADLLAACGLTESHDNLEAYSSQFGGHPLALRLFAGLCIEQPFSEPDQVIVHVRSPQDVETMPDADEPDISGEEKQKRRQRRQFYKLLSWFQQKLSPPKRRLLQLVSLFRDPVRTATLVALAEGLEAMRRDFAGCDAARITGLLEQLCAQSLLQKETDGESVYWTAHPIVRDVFRDAALAAGDNVAQQFAEIVAGKGESKLPKTVAELLPIVESIEVLLAAGDLKAADGLYRGRLENGEVFKMIPAPQEGLRCARAFLEPAKRRAEVEMTLGRGRLAFYLTWRSLAASILGEMDEVLRGFGEMTELYEHESFWAAVSIGFQNLAEAQILSGSLSEAVASASEALFYAGAEEASPVTASAPPDTTGEDRSKSPSRPVTAPELDETEAWKSRACRAHALSLAGQLAAASREFAAADALQRKNNDEHPSPYSTWGHHWTWHRFRLGETDAARRLTESNRALCERNGWNSDFARCDLLLGEFDLDAGDHTTAAPRIAAALRVFRDAKQGVDLPDSLLAISRLSLRESTLYRKRTDDNFFAGHESALSHCEEALRLAARSGFLLKKCDALNLRAQLLRAVDRADEALADANEARDIAERCGYYWGHHEALRQLRDTHRALRHTAEAREWDEAEQALTAKMAPEIAAALEINQQHDAEMKNLYGKKKQRKPRK